MFVQGDCAQLSRLHQDAHGLDMPCYKTVAVTALSHNSSQHNSQHHGEHVHQHALGGFERLHRTARQLLNTSDQPRLFLQSDM